MKLLEQIRQLFHNYWIPFVYILVAYAAYKIIYDNYEVFIDIHLSDLILLFAANFGFLFFYALALAYALKIMTNHKSDMLQGSALAFFHQFSFLSLGKGALVSTTSITKDRYGISYISSLSYFCLITSFFIFFNSTFGILTLLIVGVQDPIFWLVFIFLTCLSSSFLFLKPSMKLVHSINKLLKFIPGYYFLGVVFLKIIRIIIRFKFLRSFKHYAFLFVTCAFANLATVLRYQFSYDALNHSIGFWKASLISLVSTNVLCFVSITPGSLGVKESIDTFFASFMSIPIHSTLTATLLDRVVNILCLVILNIYAGYVLFRSK